MASKSDDGFVNFSAEMIEGDAYQLRLMAGAGLIEGDSSTEGFFFVTNEGQDLYDALKSEGIWQKTKATVAETGGNVTLEILKQIAVGYLKQVIAKKSGIEL